MLRISTIDGGVIDVDSSLMTIDDEVIAWWRTDSEEPVARWRLAEVVGDRVSVPPSAVPASGGETSVEADRAVV